MICWRVCDVVKGFARNSDDVLSNCKVVHGPDLEWKLLLRPAEHNLSNLTPFWANSVDRFTGRILPGGTRIEGTCTDERGITAKVTLTRI